MKISELTPSAKANDRITVAITYSGITIGAQQHAQDEQDEREADRHDQAGVARERLARVVGLGDLAADSTGVPPAARAGRRAQPRDGVGRGVRERLDPQIGLRERELGPASVGRRGTEAAIRYISCTGVSSPPVSAEITVAPRRSP